MLLMDGWLGQYLREDGECRSVLRVYLLADSMLPVSSATRALIRATRDSIAVEKSVKDSGQALDSHTLFTASLTIICPRLGMASATLLL